MFLIFVENLEGLAGRKLSKNLQGLVGEKAKQKPSRFSRKKAKQNLRATSQKFAEKSRTTFEKFGVEKGVEKEAKQNLQGLTG